MDGYRFAGWRSRSAPAYVWRRHGLAMAHGLSGVIFGVRLRFLGLSDLVAVRGFGGGATHGLK